MSISGAMRRLCETVPEIELLAATDDPEATLEAFSRLALFREEVQRSPSGILCLTRERYPVRLHVVPPSGWAWALQRTTGSAAHNAQLDERAGALGRAVPEAAVVGVAAAPADARDLADETAVYARLGLPLIPAELREGRGEIAAALTGRLPRLIEPGDLRGDLHTHSTWSDGHDSIETMARTARSLGREYIAVSDHSQSLGVARGLTLERLAEQQEEIAAVEAALPGLRLLRSVELDIRTDGIAGLPGRGARPLRLRHRLDLLRLRAERRAPDRARRRRPAQPARRRHRAPHRAHPRPARPAGDRPGGRAARRRRDGHGDGDQRLAQPARPQRGRRPAGEELGVKLVINTDAHAAAQLDYLHYGAEIARRAWIEPGDVLNALPLEDLLAYLRGRLQKG